MVVGLNCALILLAPLAVHYGRTGMASVLYVGYSNGCHQLPARSFSLLHHPLAVCHRCCGLYFGLLAGMLIYPFVAGLERTHLPGRGPVLCAALPLGLDVLLTELGWYTNTAGSRLTTGMLLGGVLAFYLMPGLTDMVRWLFFPRHRLPQAPADRPLSNAETPRTRHGSQKP